MAQKQQDVVENINRIVKKKTDTDRSLGPAKARKPIGSQRGMAWVNNTGSVTTASAGGSSSGSSSGGSGSGSGGPSNTGGTGGTDTGIPADADGSTGYGKGGGGGGGSSVVPADPTDPDAATDSIPGDPLNPTIPPGGTEAGSGDLTGDEAMSGVPDGVSGPVTGFGTGLPGSANENKVGYYCTPEGSSVKIRLGLPPTLPVPPEDYEDTDGDGVPEAPENVYYVWQSYKVKNGSEAKTLGLFAGRLGATGTFGGYQYQITKLRWRTAGRYSVEELRVSTGDGSKSWVAPFDNEFTKTVCAPGDEIYAPLCAIPTTEWPSDGICQLSLIDGLWVPSGDDPDCDGLTPQRCYLVSNSCPGDSGTNFCALADGGVMASEWENGGPKAGGITKIFHPNATGNGYTMTAATTNAQRDHYLYK